MVVGDIGAGAGYHTVRLSRVVGPSGTVVAQDVRRNYLTDLASRVRRLKLTNVRIALGDPHDPRLPANVTVMVPTPAVIVPTAVVTPPVPMLPSASRAVSIFDTSVAFVAFQSIGAVW